MFERSARVLLVDDRADKLLAMEACLQPLGVEMSIARSGSEALKLTEAQEFAVILLDVRMPGLDGFETAALIRQQKRSARTPIIFVSAAETPDLLEKGYALGAVDYLQNLVPQILRAKVSVFVDLYRQRLDIFAHEELEEQLRRATAAAEEASATKDRFLAALSHELRTPLTPIVALLPTLLETEGLPDTLRSDLRMIYRNVQLEAHLINDLLDLTTITKGRFPLNLQKTDAHRVALHALRIVGEDVKARQLTVEAALNAECQHVWADPTRLQQVLWNLLQNATRYTPIGGRLAIRSSNPEPGMLEIEVEDSGIGIDESEIDRLFEPFGRPSAMAGYQFGGLGLGLYIAKAIVQQHGGTLTASSAGKGHGATFRLRMPALCASQTPPGNVSLSTVAQIRPLRILLVEDHVNTRDVMARLLGKKGHEVKTAESVQSALALAAENAFDLIISDLGLPDGSGLELMPQLKSRYGLKGIAVSGFGRAEDVRNSQSAGFSAHLVKPVDFGQLEAALRELSVISGADAVS